MLFALTRKLSKMITNILLHLRATRSDIRRDRLVQLYFFYNSINNSHCIDIHFIYSNFPHGKITKTHL